VNVLSGISLRKSTFLEGNIVRENVKLNGWIEHTGPSWPEQNVCWPDCGSR
jgi:hypothetical protein